MSCYLGQQSRGTASEREGERRGGVLAADMTGQHEVDCRISISGSQLVSGEGREGHERGVREKERRVWWPWCGSEGGCVRGKGLRGEAVAAMTTDGGGSKQMSTSWWTGAERARVTEGQVDIQEHSGAAESL